MVPEYLGMEAETTSFTQGRMSKIVTLFIMNTGISKHKVKPVYSETISSHLPGKFKQ